jgi:histidinol dehydrogenase
MTSANLPVLAYTGRLEDLPDTVRRRLIHRGRGADAELVQETTGIIEQVRERGDDALAEFAVRFDGVAIETIEVPKSALAVALAEIDPRARDALEDAANAIATFHSAQKPQPISVETWPGVRLSRVAQSFAGAGVYVPGGRAAYPSSVLMGVVPARIAGVGEIVVCSPPGRDGRPATSVLAACAIAGADRVFAIGGAGAVAALAFGTESVPRVDCIVGPGNAWVAEAKRQLSGVVAIDCPAGPSEIVIVADASADADQIATEMIAQAEHDPEAAAVLVTTRPDHIDGVAECLGRRLRGQPRRAIIEASLARNGALLLARDLFAALDFASDYAAEHLLLLVSDPRTAATRVMNAGTVFLGPASSVAFGDYMTGANHVLPTGGTARAFAGLSTLDFVRWVTFQEVSEEGAATLAARTAILAETEGLPGHAAAARLRHPTPATDDAITNQDAAAHLRHPTVATDEAITSQDAAARLRGPLAPTGEGASGGLPRAASEAPALAGTRVMRLLPLRADYAVLRTYDPGRVPCEIDLSDNTNLWGPSQAVRDAIVRVAPDTITRYPTVYADSLRQALAGSLGVAAENIATGCGSDDVIDSTLRAFATAGGRIAHPVPTFGMVPAFARMNGLIPVGLTLRPDLELDVDSILAAHADITYICRPNNPTGNLFRREDVERVVRHAQGLVVIDEAYVDYSGDDLAAFAIESGRAVVLRTFSKVHGLAGLRVGFAVGPARVIAEIEKSRGPYKVGSLAEAAALAALDAGRPAIRETVLRTIENRTRLMARLEAAGHHVFPSAANFLLVRLPDGEGADAVATALRGRGVAVRPFPALPIQGNPATEGSPGTRSECIRVTIGPWPVLERFAHAFAAVTAGSVTEGSR